jgi:hypothetical protein
VTHRLAVALVAHAPVSEAERRRQLALASSLVDRGLDVSAIVVDPALDGATVTWLGPGQRTIVTAPSALGRQVDEADVAIVSGPRAWEALGSSARVSFYDAVRIANDAERSIEALAIAQAHGVIAADARIAEALAARYGLASGVVIVVAPIASELFAPTLPASRRARRDSQFGGAPLVLVIDGGRPGDAAALGRVVRLAAVELPDMRFVLAGPVSAALAGASLPPSIALAGAASFDALRTLRSTADVVLHPFDEPDAFDDVLLAAAAAGAPIVTGAPLSSFPFLASSVVTVEDGGWATALRHVMADGDERERRAAAAQHALRAQTAAVTALADAVRSAGRGGQHPRRIVIAGHRPMDASVSLQAGALARLYTELCPDGEVIACVRVDETSAGGREGIEGGIAVRRVARSAAEQRLLERSLAALGELVGNDDWHFDRVPVLNPEYIDTLVRSLRGAAFAVCAGAFTFGTVRSVWDGPIVFDARRLRYLAETQLFPNLPERAARLRGVFALEERCAREASVILCAGEADADLLVELYGARADRVLVVPPPFDPTIPFATHAERLAARERSSLAGRPVVVIAGDERTERLSAVVRFAEVAYAVPEVSFLVLGAISPWVLPQLRERKPANLHVSGPVDGAASRTILRVADVALDPIERPEALADELGCYAAAGVPIVTTPRGAARWGMASGEVLTGEPPQLAARVREALADPATAERRARALRTRLDARPADLEPLLTRLAALTASQGGTR